MIILFGGTKGGAGKTTLAVNIAAHLAREGKRFALLDADKQRTASKWASRRDEKRAEDPSIPRIFVPEKHGDGVLQFARDLETDYGLVLIDAGGSDNPGLRSAMVAADIFVAPIAPSQFDIESLEELSEIVGIAKSLNPNLDCRLIISQAEPGRGRDELSDAKDALPQFPMFTLSHNVICRRKAFRKASVDGFGVVELTGSTSREAIAEIQMFADELFEEGN